MGKSIKVVVTIKSCPRQKKTESSSQFRKSHPPVILLRCFGSFQSRISPLKSVMVTLAICKHFHQICPKYDILNPSHLFPPFRPTYLPIPLTTQQLFPLLYGRYLFFHFELTRIYLYAKQPVSLHDRSIAQGIISNCWLESNSCSSSNCVSPAARFNSQDRRDKATRIRWLHPSAQASFALWHQDLWVSYLSKK